MNAATIFEKPLQQTYQMEQRLHQQLNADVANEIIAYGQLKSTDKYNHIFDILIQRVKNIDQIYETETESKTQYFERMQQFLILTNPLDLAEELKSVFVFDEIEKEYRDLINHFSKDMFGKFYLRYQFDSQAFKGLKVGLLSDIKDINESLEYYAHTVTDHINVMKSIRSSAGGKTAFKIGTKIAGSLLAGPLGSIAAGAFANAVTNDDSKISQSFGSVLDAWGLYLDSLDHFLKNLKDRYEHIFLTLIGGLFLRVSQDIAKLHVTIEELALLEYGIEYRIIESERHTYQTWMTKTINGIFDKVRNKQYEVALKAANELFEYINQQPLLKYETYRENECYLYTASLYKVAAITTYAWSLRSNKKEFQSIVYHLFKNRPVVIKDEDLIRLQVPTQLELAIYAVSGWLDEGVLKEKATIFPNTLLMNSERYKDAGYIEGELTKDDLFTYFGITIGKFLCLQYEMKEYEYFVKELSVDTGTIKELIQTYKGLTNKDQDDLTIFMKDMITSRRIGLTLHFFKKPIVMISILVFLIGFGAWMSKDHWMNLLDREPAPAPPAQVEGTIQFVEVTTSGANVRSEPNLESKAVTAVSGGESYEILEQQADPDNRKWYKIKVRENQIGWISEKVVKVKENKE